MRLVLAALAVASAGTWAVYAMACEKSKSAQAATASMAKAKSSCAAGAATMTASAAGCAAHSSAAKTAAAASGCGSHEAAKFSAASSGSACGTKSEKATFSAASASGKAAGADGCCATKGAKSARTTMAAAGAGASCGAAMAGVSASCTGQALTMAMCKEAHAGCDACQDMASFDAELEGAGAAVQAVPIKNGVMFVYTASARGQVSAVQSAVSRRSDHLHKIVSAGDQSRLCAGCKKMRGAMASGKVSREVVSIEGGSLALVTSSDPALVRQIRAMAEAGKVSARVKS